VDTGFSANISAAKKIANWLMNRFLNNWNRDIRDKVAQSVKMSMESTENENKQNIRNNLLEIIKGCVGKSGKTVTNIEFDHNGIHVTYH